MKTKKVVVASLILGMWGFVRAGEHPSEHPKEHSMEHHGSTMTEHPAGHHTAAPAEKRPVTMADLEKAIVASRKGLTEIQDPVTQKSLKLTLVKVHRDKLSRISGDIYFACADFKTPDGKIYDLDVFMKGDSPENLVETEVTIHKEQGKPRYNWVEKDGLWSKVPVKKKK